MKNENHLQLALYKSGLKEIGTDALDGRPDVDIRRAGAKRIAMRAGGAVLAAAGVTGMGAALVYGVNHSPSVVYQDQLSHQENVQNHDTNLPTPTDISVPPTHEINAHDGGPQGIGTALVIRRS